MRIAQEGFRHYPMFRHRSATSAGVAGNGEVRSLGNNVTSILGSVVNARADTATASIKAVGGQQSGAGSKPNEVPLKAVRIDKPKMLSGLNQKVCGQEQGLLIPLSRMSHHRPIGTT